MLSLVNIGLRGVTMLGRFVMLVALAAYLPTADVGLFSLFTAVVLWAVYLQGLEFYFFSVRHLVAADPQTWARRMRDAFALYGVVFILAIPIWCAFFGMGLVPWRLFPWFLAVLAFEQVAQESYRLLNAFGRPLAGSVVLFARSGLWMYVVSFVMWRSPELRRLDVVFWGWLLGGIATVIVTAFCIRDLPWKSLVRVDWQWIRKGLAIGLPLLAGSLALRGIAVFERWYVGHLRGESMLGVFGFYATLAGAIPVLAESGIGAVLNPRMMKAWQLGDRDEYRRLLRLLWTWFAGFTILFIPGALVAVRIAAPHLHSGAYAARLDVYYVLLAAAAVWTLSSVPQYVLWARSMDRAIVAISVIGLVTAVVFDVGLVPAYGAMGAAIGQLIAVSLMLVLRVGASIRLGREPA